jgi:hypothetical protein
MRILELFSGTQSVGKAFRARGHEVVSLDLDRKTNPDHCMDIRDFDYKNPSLGNFDVIWASPPCTEYSIARTTAKTPRNFALADSLVKRTLDVIAFYLQHRELKYYFVENPQTGFLKSRPVMVLPWFKDLDYCQYGKLYRKPTRIWTNCSHWQPRPRCCKKTCHAVVDGRHKQTAQRRLGWNQKTCALLEHDVPTKLSELHALPEALCEEIVLACESDPGRVHRN